jgi:hypothetical protein
MVAASFASMRISVDPAEAACAHFHPVIVAPAVTAIRFVYVNRRYPPIAFPLPMTSCEADTVDPPESSNPHRVIAFGRFTGAEQMTNTRPDDGATKSGTTRFVASIAVNVDDDNVIVVCDPGSYET